MSKTTRYMLVNPELYKDLTTRLKFATQPELKQLMSSDQDIENILTDPNISSYEKRRLLSEAVQRLQTYKTMIDMDADQQANPFIGTQGAYSWPQQQQQGNRTGNRRHQAPGPIQPKGPVITSTPLQRDGQQESLVFPSRFTPTAAKPFQHYHQFSPRMGAEASTSASAEIPRPLDHQGSSQYESPLDFSPHRVNTTRQMLRFSPTETDEASPNYQDILQALPMNYRKSATQVLKAIESLSPNLMHIDPSSHRVVIKGRELVHIVDMLKAMGNTLPETTTTSPTLPAGIQNVVGLLARQSNLAPSMIRSPRVHKYFEQMRSVDTASPPSQQEQAAPAITAPGRRRTGVNRTHPYNPTVFSDWRDIPNLPSRSTRSYKQY